MTRAIGRFVTLQRDTTISSSRKNTKMTLYRYNGEYARGSIINIIGDSIKYTIETEISLGSPLFQHYFIIYFFWEPLDSGLR